MSIDRLEQNLNEIVAWHAIAMRGVTDEFARRLESAQAEAVDVPEHQVRAALANMLRRLEDSSQKIVQQIS